MNITIGKKSQLRMRKQLSKRELNLMDVYRESSRLISQEVSDRWRALILSPVNLSGDFSSREFAAALQHVKPGKAPDPDSICSELIIHAGTALKSWLRGFLSSCLRQLKISKSGEEHL